MILYPLLRKHNLFYFVICKLDRIRRKKLRKKYNFGEWHDISFFDKQYAIDIVDFINCLATLENWKENAVEIGCGIGDIIGNLKMRKKTGIDCSEEALRCLKNQYPTVDCILGSFEQIDKIVGKVDVLIAVNFIHGIAPDELKRNLDRILKKCDVKCIVLDCVKGEGYKYFHNPYDLCGNDYVRIARSKVYPAAHNSERWIEYWRKKDS